MKMNFNAYNYIREDITRYIKTVFWIKFVYFLQIAA